MYEEYKTTYSVKDATLSHKNTKERKNYPFFKKDLNSKSTNIYKNFEADFDINTKIEEQTDAEFLDTLGIRINGLKKCNNENTEY